MIRVVVADDQELIRGGLRVMLEQHADIEVCAEASTGVGAIEESRAHRPDVVLMDVRMPELGGLAAARVILRDLPHTRVLMLTTYDLDEYVAAALRDGASGYLLKDTAPAELLRAVRAAASGETVLAQPILRRVVEEYVERAASTTRPTDAGIHRLSGRERDVLRGLARGETNAEIAGTLFLSPATVKTHVASVLGKLGVRDRVQAVILAYETGFVRDL